MRLSWTPDKIALLRRIAAEGRPATDAARALGISRSAALGKAFRNGIKFGEGREPAAPKRRAAGPQGPRIVSRTKPRAQPVVRVEALKPAPIVERPAQAAKIVPEHKAEPVGIFDLKPRSCRYPLWQGRLPSDIAAAMFCGAPTADEKCSWCAQHLAAVSAPNRGSPRIERLAGRAA